MKTSLLFCLLLSCLTPAWSQPEEWIEKNIYAVPSLDNQSKYDTIVTLKALFAPPNDITLSAGKSVETLRWDPPSTKAARTPLMLSASPNKIISDFMIELNKKEHPGTVDLWRASSDYLCSDDIDPIESLRYIFRQSFGKAYIIPDFIEPVSSLCVSSPQYSSIHIKYCALEARNGQLPVFFKCDPKKDPTTRDNLGLVSVKTGQLHPIGNWVTQSGSTIEGPIAWIDDHHLACISLIRHITRWAVFNIKTGKILAQGEWDDQKDDDHFVRQFIIREGRFYGLQTNNTVLQLFPLPHKNNSPKSTP